MGSNAKGVSMNGFQELKNILLSAQSVNPLIGINLERRNNFFLARITPAYATMHLDTNLYKL